MVKKRKITTEANGEIISSLRLKLGLTQEEFVRKARLKYKLKISLRNLQKAEASKMIGDDTLSSIAFFLSKEAKSDEDIVTIETISKTEKQQEVSFKESLSSEKEINNFRKKIKSEKTSKTETLLLERIETRDQLSAIIKKSKLRKNFYESNYNNDQVKVISKCLKEIKEIHDSIFNVKDFWSSNSERKDTSLYSEVDQEIQNLSLLSNFGELIVELKKNNLNLYSGNYLHNTLGIKPKDSFSVNKIYDEELNRAFDHGEFKATISQNNWAIFYFSSSSDRVMEFNYNNEWFKDKLETIIDKEKFVGKGDNWQVEQYLDEHFGSEYGYYDHFQKERVSFSAAKIASLQEEKFVMDPEDYIFTIDDSSRLCRDLILSDNKFDNYIKFISQGVSQRKINKEDNKDINSRKKWLKKYNEYDFLLEDIKQIFSYYWSGHEGQSAHETIEKVKNIFLEPDNQLIEELKKTKPITEIP